MCTTDKADYVKPVFTSETSIADGKFTMKNEVTFSWPQGPNSPADDAPENHMGYYFTYMMHPDENKFF